MTDYTKYVGIAVLAAGVIASAATGQMQINTNNTDIDDISESVDENEESIELIQRTLIQRQGEQALQVQRIENEQRSQGDDLDQILLLLQQQRN